MAGQVTRTSPAPEVLAHFYHCEKTEGKCARPPCWPLTHHLPCPENLTLSYSEMERRKQVRAICKARRETRRGLSLHPCLLLIAFNCRNSQMLVGQGSVLSAVESQGTSFYRDCSDQIIGVGCKRVEGPLEQLLSRQNAMLHQY